MLYQGFADGRDEGLTALKLDAEADFLDWYRRESGGDYIGIVPKTMVPRYCGSHFPSEDRIIYFMNLWFEKSEEMCKKATWFPIKDVELIS